jgi:hypothetical protein
MRGSSAAGADGAIATVALAHASHDNRSRATDSGVDRDGSGRAIALACAALHAGVAVGDSRRTLFDGENCVRAYFDAFAAPDAFVGIEAQCRNVWNVSQGRHVLFLS